MTPELNRPRRLQTDGAVKGVLRRWWIPVILMIVVGTIASAVSHQRDAEYTASTELLFRDQQLDQRLFGTSFAAPNIDRQRQGATNEELVRSASVVRRAAASLGMSPDRLRSKLEFVSDGESDIISIEATDGSPEDAARLANAYARTYIAFRRQADRATILDALNVVTSQIAARGNGAEGDVESLRNRAEQLRVFAALQTGNVEVVAGATAPSSPSAPKPGRDGVLGGLAGLIIGVIIAVLLARTDKRVRTDEDVEELAGLPVLGRIQESTQLAGDNHRVVDPEAADGVRALRARMRYLQSDRKLQVITVNSGMPGEGKSTTAEIFARVAGETAGARVVLVEADLRAPRLKERLSLEPGLGLAEYLSNQAELDDVIRTLPNVGGSETDGTTEVILAGAMPPNPLVLLESARFAAMIEELRERYDTVVIDVPPLGSVPDAIAVIRHVDALLIVVSLPRARRDAIVRLVQELESMDAPSIGVVINRFKARRGAYGYGNYGYGAETAPASGPRGGDA